MSQLLKTGSALDGDSPSVPGGVDVSPHRGLGARRRQLSWGLRKRPSAVLDTVTLGLVAAVVLIMVVGPFFAPDVYASHIDRSLLPPSGAHWFGTDEQGRDVAWRIVVGSRQTLAAAAVTVVGYSVVGTVIAVLATIGPRWLQESLMRLTDTVMAFPSILFALAVTAALGAGLRSVMVALVVTGWTMTARLLFGIMRQTMAMPYVEGARTLGVSTARLMARHVLPNSLPSLWVKWAGDIGNTVLVIGGLSFIGAGAQPPSAEWGAMVAGASGQVSTSWWVALFPGLAIALTTAAFGLLGDLLNVRNDPTARPAARYSRKKAA